MWYPRLCRERFFGAALEGQLHAAYRDVWDADAKDSAARPGGDGESVDQVAARLKALLAELEAKHAGEGGIFVQLCI